MIFNTYCFISDQFRLTDIVKRFTATLTKTERLRNASPAITICLVKLHVGRHILLCQRNVSVYCVQTEHCGVLLSVYCVQTVHCGVLLSVYCVQTEHCGVLLSVYCVQREHCGVLLSVYCVQTLHSGVLLSVPFVHRLLFNVALLTFSGTGKHLI